MNQWLFIPLGTSKLKRWGTLLVSRSTACAAQGIAARDCYTADEILCVLSLSWFERKCTNHNHCPMRMVLKGINLENNDHRYVSFWRTWHVLWIIQRFTKKYHCFQSRRWCIMIASRNLGPAIMWQAGESCPVHTRNDGQWSWPSCQLIKQVGWFSRVDSFFLQTLNLKFVVC